MKCSNLNSTFAEFWQMLASTSCQDAEIPITPESSLMLHPSRSSQHASPQPKQPYLRFFLCHRLVLSVVEFHTDGLVQCGLFCTCLLSFSSVLLRFIRVIAHISICPCLILSMCIPLSDSTTVSPSIRLWMDTWAVASIGLLWMKTLQTSPVNTCSYFSWWTSRNRIAGS